jgi:membrane dipeptidase
VVASHAGYRFGDQSYMLDRDSVERIAARRGVIGLIMAQHQLNDGIRDDETETLDESLDVIRRHIDRISEITGSAEHVAIGSDLDGFIKPTMGGIERASDFAALEARLRESYPQDGELIASRNAVRVLKDLWSPGP